MKPPVRLLITGKQLSGRAMNIRHVFVVAASLLVTSCMEDHADRGYSDRGYSGRSQAQTNELRQACQQGNRSACVALGKAVERSNEQRDGRWDDQRGRDDTRRDPRYNDPRYNERDWNNNSGDWRN
jgi:hypothetical protein